MEKIATKRGPKPSKRCYEFSMVKRFLTMPCGTRLAATIYLPKAKRRGEKFPVLLELLPYRKDDTFYVVDYSTYSYLAEHGIITVKVDVRGTGGSQGQVPSREYSDQELADAEEIIRQLAAMPEANGNVAMWGVSWSGFNSLQVAMRRPPALKTIIAIHASDDLYHDDLHYIDGVLHLDPYHLYINHELGMPSTPSYKLDERYFADRFLSKPWLFTYLNNQQDGEFWRSHSLRENYGSINIPVYLIAGLLDGYRSAMVRMCERLEAPLKIDVGPWNHSTPDDGTPGPNYEYLGRVIRWLDYWLKGVKNGVGREVAAGKKEMLLFVRNGHSPDANLDVTPGSWYKLDWHPESLLTPTTLYPQSGGRLTKTSGKRSCTEPLFYRPGSGVHAGFWWGDVTGDVAQDDVQALAYNSAPVTEPVIIVGFPKVKLRVSSTAPRANWSVRLEDVGVDGKVSLVTGGLLNSSQRLDRLQPTLVEPNEEHDICLDLQFTTWTFQPGHRIRLSVSNSQFPMAWPSAEPMVSSLCVGNRNTGVTLPVVPSERLLLRARLPAVEDKLECPHAESIKFPGDKPDATSYHVHNAAEGSTTYVSEARSAFRIRRLRYLNEGVNSWKTYENEPSHSEYRGVMTTVIQRPRCKIRLRTDVSVESDREFFHVSVVRRVYENGKLVRRKLWKESIPRQFQ